MPTTTYLSARPDLVPQVQDLGRSAWPEFLHHGDVRNWQQIFDDILDHQIVLLDERDRLLAVGHCVPLRWDGEPSSLPDTIHGIIDRALDRNQTPNTISALAAIVSPEHQRQGHSERLLLAMRTLARERGLVSMVAPVRPILKATYPLADFDRYVRWTTSDGAIFDPWIRLHCRIGARVLHTIPRGIHVEGSVAEWAQWTGLTFSESGPYVVDGAMQPVTIEIDTDTGAYDDPNVWMLHPV